MSVNNLVSWDSFKYFLLHSNHTLFQFPIIKNMYILYMFDFFFLNLRSIFLNWIVRKFCFRLAVLKYLNVPQPWVSYYKPVTTILIIKFPNMETGSPSNASTGIWSVFYWMAGGISNVGLVCCRLHLDLMLFQLLNEFCMKETHVWL